MYKIVNDYIKRHFSNEKLIFIVILVSISFSLYIYYDITSADNILGPDPVRVTGLILANLIILLILSILVVSRFFKNSSSKNKAYNYSKLQKRIILAFSLVAAIPTIIISIFSTYFFNFGIQSWFDKKISIVLDQSVMVADSYIEEHRLQLRESAISTANDLGDMYYDLIHDAIFFSKTLNAEAEMRLLDEAIIFRRSTNFILASTPFSFSLAFFNIDPHLIEKANIGEVVELKSDPAKIRMLIKLREYNDTYLIVGRFIDNKIIDHANKTEGAASEYYRLKQHILEMQIKFSMIFIFVSILLLIASIFWGSVIAGQIVSPIMHLVDATEKVKDGDFTVQVQEKGLNKDEIKTLSSAFNRMIRQIDKQQKDLVIAQRALAWSDVARRIAHEIKNPLTPIQLSAQRLLDKFGDEVSDKKSFKKYIETIEKHSSDINRIVSEFVNFARLPLPTFTKSEIISVIADIVDSRKLINESIKYSFTANQSKIDFVFDVAQISQVMINLLKNAEEALENCKNNPKIYVAVNKFGEELEIIVSDNGIGFSSNIMTNASEAYVTTKLKGTGLGLAIVKKIVQDHLGQMELANNKNAGALIKLTFNMAQLALKLKAFPKFNL